MDLSIIVPILNEAETLPGFLHNLARQQDIAFELLLVDGGSDDAPAETVREAAKSCGFPVRLIASSPGRARQLNAGVREAKSSLLLFLHVDSLFADPLALRKGASELSSRAVEQPDSLFAARYSLVFRDMPPERKDLYYFWEFKARLDRRECTHGDQGFMIPRTVFASVGPFDEQLPIAEDTRLADRIREAGQWLLLEPEISTSARRFETEGLYQRQTLNALVMNFAAIGWDEFFSRAADFYRTQDRTAALDVAAWCDFISSLYRRAPVPERLRLWYRTGTYVRRNAWQIPFRHDVRRLKRRGLPPGQGRLSCLKLHDAWFDRLTDHPPGRFIAMLLTWAWFRLTAVRYRN